MTDLILSPPHSVEAEQGVLGGLMLDNEAWDLVGDLLQADDFFLSQHRLIFTAIQELSEKNSPFDIVTIFEAMAIPEEVGGLSYLAELAKNTPSVANIRSYAEIVRNRAHLRRIMSLCFQGTRDAAELAADAAEVQDTLEQKLFKLGEGRVVSEFTDMNEALLSVVDKIDANFNGHVTVTGVPTGITDLDEMTRGLQPADLIIVGARPSNSAAFREFAWRFVNIIAQSLVALGRRPDYEQIRRHVINIDELFIEYAQKYFAEHDPKAWQAIVEVEGKIDRKNLSFAMKDRPLRVVAIDMYLTQKRINDSVMDGLRSAVRYDKTYFDKIVASLLPLLEKLTTGRIAELLAPDYLDLADQRPIFDWMQVIRKRAVVYIGLDALSDTEVAAAVGNSMFSDLVSVAGHIYKHGIDDGLPGHMAGGKVRINLHADEFNELIGDEFIPMVNKAGGAGMQVTAYTQTMSDIEAKIGSKAKAGQVIGNFNNLFMLRVRETATAELLTNQLPKVQIYNSTPASSANDSVNGKTAFTSNSHDQVQLASVPMIEPAHVVGLPKGQAFALIEGGNLWKVRMPLPANDPDEVMPGNLQDLAAGMRRSAASSSDWWEAPGYQELKSALPEDLVEDFRQVATDDAA